MKKIIFFCLTILPQFVLSQQSLYTSKDVFDRIGFAKTDNNSEIYLRNATNHTVEFFCPGACGHLNYGVITGAGITGGVEPTRIRIKINHPDSWQFFSSINEIKFTQDGGITTSEIVDVPSGAQILFAGQWAAPEGQQEFELVVEELNESGEVIDSGNENCSTDLINGPTADAAITASWEPAEFTSSDIRKKSVALLWEKMILLVNIENRSSEEIIAGDLFMDIDSRYLELCDDNEHLEQMINGIIYKLEEPIAPESTHCLKIPFRLIGEANFTVGFNFTNCSFDPDLQNNQVQLEFIADPISSIFSAYVDNPYGEHIYNIPPFLNLEEETDRFLNVGALINNPGSPIQVDWIVQNQPILPIPTQFSFQYNTEQNLKSINIVSLISEDLLLSFPTLKDSNRYVSLPIMQLQGTISQEPEIEELPANVVDIEYAPWLFGQVIPETKLYFRKEVPNIDLDESKNNCESIEGYAGDKNACAPTAAANSIQWLENTVPEMKNTKSLREKLIDLSKKMKRNKQKGTSPNNFVKGKICYFHENKQSVSVKFQGRFKLKGDIKSDDKSDFNVGKNENVNEGGWPTWEFLTSELEKGKDVELRFGFYHRGKREGGHMTMLTGFSEVNGRKMVMITDDGSQCNTDPNGLRTNHQIEWREIDGIPYLGHGNRNGVIRIADGVISECYDKNVVHNMADLFLKLFDQDPKNKFTDGNVTDVRKDNHSAATFSVTLAPSNTIQYLNAVLIDGNKRSWVLQNVIIPPLDSLFSFHIPIPNQLLEQSLSSDDLVEIELGLAENLSTHLEDIDILYRPDVSVSSDEYVYGSGVAENKPSSISPIIPAIYPIENLQLIEQKFQDVGSLVFDLDSLNNSLHWAADGPGSFVLSLENQAAQINDLELPQSSSELFSLALQAYSINQSGYHAQELVEGMLAFIDNQEIPMSIRFQDIDIEGDHIESPVTTFGHRATNDSDVDLGVSWEWVKEQLDSNTLVQLALGRYDDQGIRIGGNWVTISGYNEFNNGLRQIYFYSDVRQDTFGGIVLSVADWQEESGITILGSLSNAERTLRVESVITVRYDNSINFESTSSKSTEGLFEGFFISPNPFEDQFDLYFESSQNQSVSYSIHNSAGQFIQGHQSQVFTGKNTFKVSSVDWPLGMYIIALRYNGGVILKKIIKG